jgi:plastocyanin
MQTKTIVSVLFAGLFIPLVISVAADGEKPADPTAKEDKDSKTPPRDPSVGGPAADPKTTGAVAGIIVLDGKMPEMKPLAVDPNNKDRPTCGAEIPNERLLLGAGNTVLNAVVSLAKLPPGEKAPKRTITLDNSHCRFVPHVQATTAGSTIRVTNHDPGVLHSAMAVLGAQWNVSVTPDRPVEKTLPRPGRVVIKCAVHSWMDASVWVFPHEFFAVSSKDGKFRIEGIPPGTYQLKIEHEACEEALKEFTVEAGKTAELKIGLKPFE